MKPAGRYRRALWTVLSSLGVRGVSMIATLVSVPVAFKYLGRERYGLFVLITSLIGLLSFADIGMGGSLVNAVGEARARQDNGAARTYISSAMFVLSIAALILLAIFAAIYPHIPWAEILNVATPRARAEAGPALATFLACFLISLPLGLVERIQLALQAGYIYNFFFAGASVGDRKSVV